MKKNCQNCEHLGRDCPKKLMLMPLDDLVDWCRYIMAQYHITHDQIAHLANTPKGTVDRILAKQSTDCKYSTIHAIVCALFEVLGVSAVCLDETKAAEATQADDLKRQNAELQRALADSEKERQALQTRLADHAETQALLKAQLAKADTRIDLLSGTLRGWRRVVKILSVLLGVAVLGIIAALVVDLLSPNIGFLWRY